MKLDARPGRVTAWIAILAMLLAALAPSVARALSPPQQTMPWTDICSVVGTQSAPDSAPLPGSGQHEGAAFKHCPFCLNHAGHFALPAGTLDPLPVFDSGNSFFSFSTSPPASRLVRATAQPRAPPINS